MSSQSKYGDWSLSLLSDWFFIGMIDCSVTERGETNLSFLFLACLKSLFY